MTRDAAPAGRVVYVGSQLPKRSETFVYREVLGLRARGRGVVPASVRVPERDLGEPALDALACEAVVVYAPGFVGRGLCELLRRPGVAWRLVRDVCGSRDVKFTAWPKVFGQMLGGLSLARQLRQRFGDVNQPGAVQRIHAHMAHVPATIAMVAADALSCAFSFTGHAADLFRDRQLLRAKLRRADFVACISAWHRGFYREVEAGLRDAQLPVIRCGVDLAEFAPVEDDEARSGDPEADLRAIELLAVGRLVPKKGFAVLLEAWSAWLERHGLRRDFSDGGSTGRAAGPMLVIMGDGPERGRLERKVQDLKLSRNVEFTGDASNRQVRARMRGCTAFALPCVPADDGDRDGIPVVLMEAMACGKPVISGDLPAIRELIVDADCGALVEPGDVDMLVSALDAVLTQPRRRERMGKAARARVAEEFAADVNLDRLESAFDGAFPGASGHEHGGQESAPATPINNPPKRGVTR